VYGGGLLFSGTMRDWLHTRGAIARPGEGSILQDFFLGEGNEMEKCDGARISVDTNRNKI
jgi:hypothetical protein